MIKVLVSAVTHWHSLLACSRQLRTMYVFRYTKVSVCSIVSTVCSCFVAVSQQVDHPGVPNSQLIKEGAAVASFYGNKSVAEQNSVEIVRE